MASWNLSKRFDFEGNDVAYEVMGDGPPLVLVHGFPGNSFSWRHVAPALAKKHRVHVYDMLGFGQSAMREGRKVFGESQTRLLAGLLKHWKLDAPLMVAHDIGTAPALGAHLFEGRQYGRLILLSAAVLNPSVSANSMHARAHLKAYQTMPAKLYAQIMRAHIPTTMHSGMSEEIFQGYFGPWSTPEGQAAYYRFLGDFEEPYLDQIEAKLDQVVPETLILWGDDDTWIPLARGEKLQKLVPRATLRLVPKSGHFLMDDNPDAVIREIEAFAGK